MCVWGKGDMMLFGFPSIMPLAVISVQYLALDMALSYYCSLDTVILDLGATSESCSVVPSGRSLSGFEMISFAGVEKTTSFIAHTPLRG